MSARIFQPSRPATQSGNAKSQGWVLEFYPEMSSKIDPLMGWTSSGEMQAQVKLNFPENLLLNWFVTAAVLFFVL